eukprot:gene31008-40341_t
MDDNTDWKVFLGSALSCNLPLSVDCKDTISNSNSSADTFIGSSKSKDDSGIETYNANVTPFHPDIDTSTPASILNSLFQGVICPAPVIRKGGSEIGLPEQYSVNVSDNCLNFSRISILLQYDVFIRTPVSFQKSLLDMLYLILRKDIYTTEEDISPESNRNNISSGLTCTLLTLLSNYRQYYSGSSLAVSKRIIHLVGVVSETGISVPDLKTYLSLLKVVMIRQDNGISKASLSTYFDFGGIGSGLFVPNTSNALPGALSTATFPFLKEYQMCTWFRVENFELPQQAPLPSQVIESIARLDAKRPVDGIDNMHTYIVDLLPQILNSADKKMVPLMSKLAAELQHPRRTGCIGIRGRGVRPVASIPTIADGAG